MGNDSVLWYDVYVRNNTPILWRLINVYDVHHQDYMRELKARFDNWCKIVAAFDKMNEVPANLNNLTVMDRLIDRVLKAGEDLYKKEENGYTVIYHAGEQTDGEHDNMVYIHQAAGKLYTSTCTMWRTILGMNERLRGD